MPRTRKPTHPGAIILHDYMKPLDLTVTALAAHLGISRKHLSQVIHEWASVTSGLALRLARAFGTTPDLWLNLQRKRDLWEAERETPGLEDVTPLPGVQGMNGDLLCRGKQGITAKTAVGSSGFIITPEEKKRRDRVLRETSASCAIEGLRLSKEDREEIKELYMTCATSDEMIMRYKKKRGLK